MLEVGVGRHADAAGAGPEPVSLVAIASPEAVSLVVIASPAR
jgi:hypothetical protein